MLMSIYICLKVILKQRLVLEKDVLQVQFDIVYDGVLHIPTTTTSNILILYKYSMTECLTCVQSSRETNINIPMYHRYFIKQLVSSSGNLFELPFGCPPSVCIADLKDKCDILTPIPRYKWSHLQFNYKYNYT